MATPYAAFGCVIEVFIGAAYVPVASVRDIAGPAIVSNAIDTSSRTGIARTFLPGMQDSGEVTFDILYDPDADSHSLTVAGGLAHLQLDQTVCNWRLTFPTATTVVGAVFSGFVTNFAIKTPLDDAMTADLTIKISGAVTIS